MKELSILQMEEIEGGANGWYCVGAGAVAGVGIVGAFLGVFAVTYAAYEIATALVIACGV